MNSLSAMNKIFDYVMQEKYSDCFKTADTQFAFKSEMSTTTCTLALKDVVKHYMKQGGKVYACLLDASKAFDRIRFDFLFDILIARRLPAVFIRLLMDSYQRQMLRTGWMGNMSQSFTVSNGVKQGGVASPVMFTLYVDELLRRLEKEGTGCHIGNFFLGCLCYADDLTLLAPTRNALQIMINTCEKFALEYEIIFNSKKTKCICFSQKEVDNISALQLNGNFLEWTSTVEHLGHHLKHNLSEALEIQTKQNSFIKSVNSVLVKCAKLPRTIVSSIYLGQCHSFYGCQTWDLTSPRVENFNVTWRKATRRIWGLPSQTRSAILPFLLRGLTFIDIICRRTVKLKAAMDLSKNERLKYLSGLETSLIPRNIVFISEKYENLSAIGQQCGYEDNEFFGRAMMLDELVACRDGLADLQGFSHEEINCYIYFVACDRL